MASPTILDEEVYRAVRRNGASKKKAARIAMAAATEGRSKIGKRGGKAKGYDDMSVKDLQKRAKKLDIHGRSKMKKKELIKALRKG